MKLYNQTKIDDEVLSAILYRAAKAVGSVRTQNTVIKVTTSVWRMHGRVHRPFYMYYEKFLKGQPYSGDAGGSLVRSDGGYMFLSIPNPSGDQRNWEALDFAEAIYELAAHEWRHVRDFQKGERYGDYNRNWKNRPHERRAISSTKRAVAMVDKDERIQDAIIALGLDIERIRKEVMR